MSVNGYYNVVVKEVCMSYDSLRRSYSYDNGLENESYSENLGRFGAFEQHEVEEFQNQREIE